MKEDFERALNQHGYAFQHRVLAEFTKLASARLSSWSLLYVEYPVSVGERTSRIDFLLEDATRSQQAHLLIAECKRVNPAFSTWCFARAPYVRPSWAKNQLVVESLHKSDGGRVLASASGCNATDDIYEIAFVAKADEQGNRQSKGRDRDAIEEACTQVCTGLNGLIQTFAFDKRLRSVVERNESFDFLPVVFTTAKLLVSKVDLKEADLLTGQAAVTEVEERPWVFYQYPQSPPLKHGVEREVLASDSFEQLAARDYVRSVGIVAAHGIGDFLARSWLG